MPGPIALVGSGEYTPAMLEVERELLAGRAPRYVQIPTAAGREGPARLRYWVELGQAQCERLGVEAVPLMVTQREQADDPAIAAAVRGAGLVYLSGGSPAYLADTLRDTLLWRAIVEAWEAGAALAGCSAGAMVMADRVPDLFHPSGGDRAGFGLLPHIRVLPHFDAMVGRMPDLVTRPFLRPAAGVTLVGIDENTALVGGPEVFTVRGKSSVWLLGGGPRRGFGDGTALRLPADGTPAGPVG
jgi:cyanophycinase-like exopeptidase